jgi:hypothetical protein
VTIPGFTRLDLKIIDRAAAFVARSAAEGRSRECILQQVCFGQGFFMAAGTTPFWVNDGAPFWPPVAFAVAALAAALPKIVFYGRKDAGRLDAADLARETRGSAENVRLLGPVRLILILLEVGFACFVGWLTTFMPGTVGFAGMLLAAGFAGLLIEQYLVCVPPVPPSERRHSALRNRAAKPA